MLWMKAKRISSVAYHSERGRKRGKHGLLFQFCVTTAWMTSLIVDLKLIRGKTSCPEHEKQQQNQWPFFIIWILTMKHEYRVIKISISKIPEILFTNIQPINLVNLANETEIRRPISIVILWFREVFFIDNSN